MVDCGAVVSSGHGLAEDGWGGDMYKEAARGEGREQEHQGCMVLMLSAQRCSSVDKYDSQKHDTAPDYCLTPDDDQPIINIPTSARSLQV